MANTTLIATRVNAGKNALYDLIALQQEKAKGQEHPENYLPWTW